MVLTAVLAIVIGGTALAAPADAGNGDQLRDCSCGDCVCDDCVPIEHNWNWSQCDVPSGPHGPYKVQRGISD